LFFRKKNKIEGVYAHELRKRDSEIADLMKKNELLLKTALKQSNYFNECKEYSQKLEKHVRRLEEEIKALKRAKA
jgi:hypothetical protein